MKKFTLSLILSLSILFAAFMGASCGCKHSLIEVEEVAATCVLEGVNGHYKCGYCGLLFADKYGKKQIEKSQTVMQKTSFHNYAWVAEENLHRRQCVDCNKEEDSGEHQIIDLQANNPTLTKDGNEKGKICSVCGYITEGGKTIPARSPFRQKTYNNLNYCQYMPQIPQGEKVPLVLFLHGAGERGSDNQRQLNNAILRVVNNNSDSKFMEAAVIAPQCPQNLFWTNAEHAEVNYKLTEVPETEILKSVVDLVEEYLSYEYIDQNRVYVIGLSMGGFATWDLLARHSNLFAAGVPICGGGPTDAIATLKNIPIYTFHGALDFMVPYEGTYNMVQLIKNAGGNKINFKSYENDDHIIWDDAITFEGDESLPSLEEWLFFQSK